jgi:hypothetical protein
VPSRAPLYDRLRRPLTKRSPGSDAWGDRLNVSS